MPDMAHLGDPAKTSSQRWKMDRDRPCASLGETVRVGRGASSASAGSLLWRLAVRMEAAFEPWDARVARDARVVLSSTTQPRPDRCSVPPVLNGEGGLRGNRRLLRATRGALEHAESRRGPAVAVAAGDDTVRRSTHTPCRRPRLAAHARTTVGYCPDKTHGTEAFLTFL
jgi:hypothetical protein